ncbi:hypothetical protein [Nocardioides sp.]|uniref:hypothetical protein n=1 Tax=Nocardioides sp. TaxID=35761 RepID=UPI00271A6895|nr:hypothetical protein [Nocardioides sp.]MDO9458319.1 hypothetical protein [Nocardioides sp.]
MKTWRHATIAALLAAPLIGLTTASATADLPTRTAGTAPDAAPAGVATYADEAGDVRKRKLDLRKVVVRNTADAVTVRVLLPGVRRTYDYPLGYVSVWLDTDRARRGPEYGHFMQFWSDYRFAETQGWREDPTPEWGHSPEGACVADAGLRGDRKHRLRWFEYRVVKRDGCFEADAVRVAVTTVNEGENHPYRLYDRPFRDHLTAKHAWTPWVEQAG